MAESIQIPPEDIRELEDFLYKILVRESGSNPAKTILMKSDLIAAALAAVDDLEARPIVVQKEEICIPENYSLKQQVKKKIAALEFSGKSKSKNGSKQPRENTRAEANSNLRRGEQPVRHPIHLHRPQPRRLISVHQPPLRQ